MGIENLLQFMKPAMTESSIVNYRGKIAAIDAMSWLYRGCYSCAQDLNHDIPTNDFLYFISKMISMLREYDVTPYMVFDGRHLKAKEKTEQFRKKTKLQNLAKGNELVNEGKQTEARKYFQRCLKINKQMLYTTFDFLKELKVQYLIAPYEADAQMTHLCLSGQCDFAITEDSDLICYQCPWIVFKLQADGSCLDFQLEKLRESRENRQHIKNEDVRVFLAFNNIQLIDVCILSGCDYVPSVKGIGIKKATELMNKMQNIHNVITKLKRNKTYAGKIPKDYERIIKSMRMIFQFQTVYDPIQQKQIQLNQLQYQDYQDKIMKQLENKENNENQISDDEQVIVGNQLSQIIGESFPQELQTSFSVGDLDFKTLQTRERMKVDFIQIFRKIDRQIQNQQKPQIYVDLTQTKANIKQLKEKNIENLNDQFINDSELKEPVFIEPRQSKKEKEQDIFKLCEQLFDEQQPYLEQYETIVDSPRQNEDQEEEEEENPFAVQFSSDIKQCMSQIKTDDLIQRPQQSQIQKIFNITPQDKDKTMKQTQSKILSYVKKKNDSLDAIIQ